MMTTAHTQTHLDRVTFTASELDQLAYAEMRKTLKEYSMVRVCGLFDPIEIRRTRKAIATCFDPSNDRKHDCRDTESVRRNFQKLQIGANSGLGTRRTLGRFLRILYNPIFDDDAYGMREHFIKLARFRNLLYDIPVDFAVTSTEKGLWTCSRILQYPIGGGFMVPHRDMFSQAASIAAGLDYYQPLLLLSEKGTDYIDGGAFIDHEGQRIYYEDDCRAGDVIVYDGRSIHGVGDIDPLEPLDLVRFSGRVVAFASLFRHLQPGTRDYGELGHIAEAKFGLGEPSA